MISQFTLVSHCWLLFCVRMMSPVPCALSTMMLCLLKLMKHSVIWNLLLYWRHSTWLGKLHMKKFFEVLKVCKQHRHAVLRCQTNDFYHVMLCIRGTSHGTCVCVCVCLSVTSRSFTKTAMKRMITQTRPHDSPGSLVFWCQRFPRNSTGVTPYEGSKWRWGGSKSATFHK